jgi:Predicted dehydrogenases and related proteins
MKVGIIGCGNIADIYFKNSQKYFNNFDIIACADIKEDASVHYSKLYGVESLSVDKL